MKKSNGKRPMMTMKEFEKSPMDKKMDKRELEKINKARKGKGPKAPK